MYLFYYQILNLQALIANKNPDELALKVWGIHEASIPPWQKSILKVTLPILKKSLIALLIIDKEVSLKLSYHCKIWTLKTQKIHFS